MKKTLTALTIAAMSLGGVDAMAKGNGGSEEREALRAELDKARAKAKAEGSSESGGLFSIFFGEKTEDQAEADTSKTTN
ncbi:MAG: hypothetical protein AAGC81_17145 [Pseudomonadota bacterium]